MLQIAQGVMMHGGGALAATKAHRMEMMSGEASVGPCASLTKPVIMEASRTKKQSPGIHRSRKALFMSMLAPFSVVLNLMVPPQMEFTARHTPSRTSTCALAAVASILAWMLHAIDQPIPKRRKELTDSMPCLAMHSREMLASIPAAGLQMTPTEHVRMSCRYWDGQGPAVQPHELVGDVGEPQRLDVVQGAHVVQHLRVA